LLAVLLVAIYGVIHFVLLGPRQTKNLRKAFRFVRRLDRDFVPMALAQAYRYF
jgi:hypothetical protein